MIFSRANGTGPGSDAWIADIVSIPSAVRSITKISLKSCRRLLPYRAKISELKVAIEGLHAKLEALRGMQPVNKIEIEKTLAELARFNAERTRLMFKQLEVTRGGEK